MPLPVLLRAESRLAVVVGAAGRVGRRRVGALLDAGFARVRAVDPRGGAFEPGVEVVARAFDEADLADAAVCVAATADGATNARVAALCRAAGVLVNRADEGDDDFDFLAARRAGAVLVAVSAGGAPALGARLIDELVARLDPADLALAAALAELRPWLRAHVADEATRRDLMRRAAGDEGRAVARGGADAVKAWVRSQILSPSPFGRGPG